MKPDQTKSPFVAMLLGDPQEHSYSGPLLQDNGRQAQNTPALSLDPLLLTLGLDASINPVPAIGTIYSDPGGNPTYSIDAATRLLVSLLAHDGNASTWDLRLVFVATLATTVDPLARYRLHANALRPLAYLDLLAVLVHRINLLLAPKGRLLERLNQDSPGDMGLIVVGKPV